jgi:hypothetical protein
MKYINFEIAKLLKSKDFKEPCLCHYTQKGVLKPPFLENGSSTDTEFRVELEDLFENHNDRFANIFSAPTISEVQDWLLLNHKIWVTVIPNISFKKWKPVLITKGFHNIYDQYAFDTCEQAITEAILYVLSPKYTLIKKQNEFRNTDTSYNND